MGISSKGGKINILIHGTLNQLNKEICRNTIRSHTNPNISLFVLYIPNTTLKPLDAKCMRMRMKYVSYLKMGGVIHKYHFLTETYSLILLHPNFLNKVLSITDKRWLKPYVTGYTFSCSDFLGLFPSVYQPGNKNRYYDNCSYIKIDRISLYVFPIASKLHTNIC